MIKGLATLMTATVLLPAQLLDYDIRPSSLHSEEFMKIKILDAKEVSFARGSNISELSALAFSKKRLYALSDNGELYHYNLELQKNKIKTLELQERFILKNKKGKRLKKKKRDSEGLALVDNTLYISFEKKSRVDQYSLEGIKLQKVKIHKRLRDYDNYQKGNKGLEAVVYSKKYEVITAPEIPLKGESKTLHTLYAKKDTWKFKASGSLTAMAFMDEDKLLILERDFRKLTLSWVITLSSVDLVKSDAKGLSKQKTLAILDGSDGWRVDNFEGLTKVSKNRFLMVSDDNDNFFQKTLLVLFEVLD